MRIIAIEISAGAAQGRVVAGTEQRLAAPSGGREALERASDAYGVCESRRASSTRGSRQSVGGGIAGDAVAAWVAAAADWAGTGGAGTGGD